MPNDSASSLYDLDCTDLHGHAISMSSFRGHPILIVNTASLCGYSVQFKGLEDIWNEYKDKGLVVLGAPTGDFGRQELGSNAEIVTMCSTKFGVTFPLLAKMQVHGKGAHPLFQWIAEEGGFLARPRWNFYKYFISADGRLQNWFSTLTPPTSPRFARAVTELTAAA